MFFSFMIPGHFLGEKERKRGGGKEGGGRKEGKKCQSLLGKWLCNFIQLLQYETYVAAINDKAI